MGDSVHGHVLRFDWSGSDCAFGQVPVSFSITGSESPDHVAAITYRMQEPSGTLYKIGDKCLFCFFKGSHTHAHIPVWLFEGC